MAGLIAIIGEMVRNIAIIALLSLFWEILLPKGKTKAFAQVVLGLLVILVVLNPLGKLFKADVSAVSWQSYQDAPSGGIISAGTALEDKWQSKAAAAYEESLKKQIKALALLVENVADAEVRVSLENYKSLEKIDVILTLEKPVADEKPLRQKVESAIGNFYGLPSEQIEVFIAVRAE